jgi:hypothetical protein
LIGGGRKTIEEMDEERGVKGAETFNFTDYHFMGLNFMGFNFIEWKHVKDFPCEKESAVSAMPLPV